MTQKFTILFDLDGTLVDTAPDLMNAHNHVMRKFGYETKSTDDIRKLVGQGAGSLIGRSVWGQAKKELKKPWALDGEDFFKTIKGPVKKVYSSELSVSSSPSVDSVPSSVSPSSPSAISESSLSTLGATTLATISEVSLIIDTLSPSSISLT